MHCSPEHAICVFVFSEKALDHKSSSEIKAQPILKICPPDFCFFPQNKEWSEEKQNGLNTEFP